MYTKRELKRAEGIIRQIARENNVSEKQVRADMKEAIDAGRNNPDPDVQSDGRNFSSPERSRPWRNSFCGRLRW